MDDPAKFVVLFQNISELMHLKMKLILVIFSIISTTFAGVIEDTHWVSFKNNHGKVYSNAQEEQLRYVIFQENLKMIEEHNLLYQAGQETYEMGVNKFADWSRDEYLNLLRHQSQIRPKLESGLVPKPLEGEVPDSIDWRDVGAVSEVKDQGSCGSCWSFSVTGTLESFYFLKNKEMLTFSEQQLVDCDKSNYGCVGGEEAPALEYVKNYGIQSETSYPYEGKTLTCRYNESAATTKIAGYVQIDVGDEAGLLQAVGLLGPISVALDATDLVFYYKGVFTSKTCSTTSTNHAVLAVGYGVDEDTGLDYWLIKNSWGAAWGKQGYFLIQRGVNECAIAIDNVYPVL